MVNMEILIVLLVNPLRRGGSRSRRLFSGWSVGPLSSGPFHWGFRSPSVGLRWSISPGSRIHFQLGVFFSRDGGCYLFQEVYLFPLGEGSDCSRCFHFRVFSSIRYQFLSSISFLFFSFLLFSEYEVDGTNQRPPNAFAGGTEVGEKQLCC